MLAGDSPDAFSSRTAESAPEKDEVDTRLGRYRSGINASIKGAGRIYMGKIARLNACPARRSSTRGWRMGILPTPVINARG